MSRRSVPPVLALAVALLATGLAHAADEYQVEKVPKEPQEISAEIAVELAGEAFLVKRENRTVCTIWLRKNLPVEQGSSPGAAVNYPFREGALVGVIHYGRRGNDFRDREVPRGYYTLRYGKQPVDGNHIGTFPTRDFLLLVSAGDDRSPGDLPADQLLQISAQSVESTHPGILCLLNPAEASGALPAVRHREDEDWWVLQLAGSTGAGDSEQRIDLVIVGYAEE